MKALDRQRRFALCSLVTAIFTYFISILWITTFSFSSFLLEVDQRFQMVYVRKLKDTLSPLLNPIFQKEEVEKRLEIEEKRNPRMRYYILNDDFVIVASSAHSPLSPEGLRLDEIFIKRLLRRGRIAIPIEAADPLQMTIRRPFVVIPITLGDRAGFIYGVIGTSEWEAGGFGARAFLSLRQQTYLYIGAALLSLLLGVAVQILTSRKTAKDALSDQTTVKAPDVNEVADLVQTINSVTNSLVAKTATIENRDEQRRSFVAGISHDLRSPLNSIKVHLSYLIKVNRELDPTERDKSHRAMLKNVDQVLKMIDQFFQLATFESLETSAKMRPFAADDCLRDVLSKFKPLALEKDIELKRSVEDGNLRCNGDSDLVHRALCNLVENALKYSSPGGKVVIGVEREAKRAVE